MAIANVTLDDTVPGTTQTVIYAATAPTAVTVLYLCNNDTGTRTVDLFLVPNGNNSTVDATDGERIYKDISIPAGDTFVIDMEKLILDVDHDIVGIVGEGDSGAVDVTSVIATISTIGI